MPSNVLLLHFSLKTKVMGLNPGYLLKSKLAFGFGFAILILYIFIIRRFLNISIFYRVINVEKYLLKP